jgi:hypothetical protein
LSPTSAEKISGRSSTNAIGNALKIKAKCLIGDNVDHLPYIFYILMKNQ